MDGGAEVGVWTVLERMCEMRMGLPLSVRSVAVTMRCRNRLHPLTLFVPLFDMPLKSARAAFHDTQNIIWFLCTCTSTERKALFSLTHTRMGGIEG